VKIAIIGSRGIPARYGGFEIFAERLARGLADRGFEIYVYCKKELKKQNCEKEIVNRIFVPLPKIMSLKKLWLSNYSILHASLIEKVDTILLLGVSGALSLFIPQLTGIKTVLNPDGLEWKRAKWGRVGRSLLKFLEIIGIKFSNFIVADSMAIREYIRDRYKKDAVYIPYGTDIPSFRREDWEAVKKRYSLSPGEYYTVVGRDVPENNFSLIINGFLKSGSNKKLVVVSDLGDSYKKYRGKEKIMFTGPIYERGKLFALRTNAFAHIHGHSVGGTNPSLLEAIASGNLIFAYDVPFNKEVLGEYGLYFSDKEQLTSIITKTENDRGRAQMLKRVRKYYSKILKERYNWKQVISSYIKILDSVFP